MSQSTYDPACRLCGEPRDTGKKICSRCLDDPPIWRPCARCRVVFKCAVTSGARRELVIRKYCSDECRSREASDAQRARCKVSVAKTVATCEQCAAPFAKIMSTKRFCSAECQRKSGVERKRVSMACAWCDKPITRSVRADCPRSFCGMACQQSYAVCVTRGKSSGQWPRAKCEPTEVACIDCGLIEVAHPYRLRCESCKRRNKRQRKSGAKGRRWARRRAYIIERDKGKCHVCKRKVRTDNHLHPRAAEIDHIIPRSLWPAGVPGLNNPANLRLLCRTCNSEKSNGTAPGGDQLLLVG